MKEIVVLDGFTLNPGDLSWSGFDQLGNVTVHDRTAMHQIIERASRAEIVLTNKTPLNSDILEHLPRLKYIGVLATGYNVVDVNAAHKKGVTITNVPGYSTFSVVQHTFALLLELCNQVGRHSDSVMSGDWVKSTDFSYRKSSLIELQHKTIGIIGYGEIGRQVANVAASFGMNVLITSRTKPADAVSNWAELDVLFRKSDVISIHCPLTPQTENLVNSVSLSWMKKSAFLINTARGPIVSEPELANALNQGIIAGAGLDVLSVEPPSPDNPLLSARNCIITPHIAWASKEARQRLMDQAIRNLMQYQAGNPVNIVV